MSIDAATYDFIHPEHQLRTKWPVLEQIHAQVVEAFARHLSDRLQATIGHAGSATRPRKCQELVEEIGASALVQEIALRPLNGVAWLCVDASVITALVDLYFGGSGVIQSTDVVRKPTVTELRVLQHVSDAMLRALIDAWSSVQALQPEIGGLVDTGKLSKAGNGMVVIDADLLISLPSGEASCRLIYPYSQLEPLGSRLVHGTPSQDHPDARFSAAMRRELMTCDIELHGVMAQSRMSVRQLLDLKVGDFIPLRDVETVSFRAQQIPLFDAQVGKSNGRVSASFSRWHPNIRS